MIHVSYCKINEYHASFRLLQQFLLTNNRLKAQNVFELQTQFGESWPIISEHLNCLKKAEKKLPTWVKKQCIFANTPFEQATSEVVAQFKASLFPVKNMLSITGGLGSDDIAFAQSGTDVTSLDTDPCLNALFDYNCKQLEIAHAKRVHTSAEDYLLQCKNNFEMVYADPDRRPDGEKLGGNVSAYSPDVFGLMRTYSHIAPRWLIKLSPITDIHWLLQETGVPMNLHIIEEANEVKEVLCDCHEHATGEIWLHVLQTDKSFTHNGTILETLKSDKILFTEPRSGMIKSGFHSGLAGQFAMEAQTVGNTYFTGYAVLPTPLCRQFELNQEIRGSFNHILSEIKKLGIVQANISARECSLGAEEIRKKSKLKDGGDVYLFFTGKNEKTCFVCSKI